ncbi:DUF2231 domain-containing protein [Fibrisoma montanum]|uniref:DUF2231 domain-containing protein n=1 Tax=Fibrisoma montanum TaxID=2305895 RepID=A0A418M0U0_9BACT|nr:DUF2231 domain-containing protein [Fibrisoma montanum]RIV19308.1 DUF2231 domain-containing protein [Fibrisoma montanum]
MESRAKIAGHPAHPILIVFPLGLLATAVIFDIVYLLNDNPMMATVSYWMIVAGLIGGLVAAVPGWKDWFNIPSGTRAKQVGLVHGLGNVLVLLLFAVSWLFRRDEPSFLPSTPALALSFLGFAIAGFTGWLGGEMVDRLGVGVDNGAHLNAPNSLSGRPASDVDPGYNTGRIKDTHGRERFA